MKAPTLLEALAEIAQIPPPYAYPADRWEMVQARMKFYSMVFTPDLLTGEKAVFAGWESNIDFYDVRFFDEETGIEWMLEFHENTYYLYGFLGSGDTIEYDFIKANSIDDFMADITRTGIPLTFTPYGEKLWRGED